MMKGSRVYLCAATKQLPQLKALVINGCDQIDGRELVSWLYNTGSNTIKMQLHALKFIVLLFYPSPECLVSPGRTIIHQLLLIEWLMGVALFY
jgi:hypothetical protein